MKTAILTFMVSFFLGYLLAFVIRKSDFRAGWYMGAYTVAEDLIRNGQVTPERQEDLFLVDSIIYYDAIGR